VSAGEGVFTLLLEKEDFKFSCAHFTVFGPDTAELLHGHNYHLRVELEGTRLDGCGLLADIARFKEAVRAACRRLDSRTLVPEASPYLGIERDAETVRVSFGDRRYSLPARDVVVMPLVNTSIELLAELLWTELAPALSGSNVEAMTVAVAETAGQACAYRARLPASTAPPKAAS
jgi:6-pyruvoyltetrahydropterin/6-carboxytetrahydropterin synthase